MTTDMHRSHRRAAIANRSAWEHLAILVYVCGNFAFSESRSVIVGGR